MNEIKRLSMIIVIVFLISSLVNIGSFIEDTPETIERNQQLDQVPPLVAAPTEVVNTVAPTRVKALASATLDSLKVTRVVLTPGVDPRSTMRITFNMTNKIEAVEVMVMDEEGYEVGKTIATATELSVAKDNENSEDDHSDSELLYVYKAELNGLKAGTQYTYVVKAGTDYSRLMTFRTLRQSTTEIAFFGDIQGYKLSQYERIDQVFDAALNKMPSLDLAYLAGDIVDNGGAMNQWHYLDMASSDVLESNLFISTIGNHDVYGGPNIYTHTFNYPKNGPAELEERCFYIDLPNGRIASIDTESYSLYEEQRVWLESVMSDVEGFKIVLMHRSVYPISYDEAHVRTWSKTFDHLNIDLVLSGHDHVYSRTTMKNEEKVEAGQGTTYIVGGSGSGSKFYYDMNEGHRHWKDVVYDDDYPVFTLLDIQASEVIVAAYALIDGKSELVDFFRLTE